MPLFSPVVAMAYTIVSLSTPKNCPLTKRNDLGLVMIKKMANNYNPGYFIDQLPTKGAGKQIHFQVVKERTDTDCELQVEEVGEREKQGIRFHRNLTFWQSGKQCHYYGNGRIFNTRIKNGYDDTKDGGLEGPKECKKHLDQNSGDLENI